VLEHGVREPGHGGHCMEQVTWVKGWTKVWSCELHADELVGARRMQ